MRILAAVLFLGAVGCADNLSDVQQLAGGENCSTVISTSSSGAVVSVTIDDGFNAWNPNNTPAPSVSGQSTTCTGTVVFNETVAGSWVQGPNNQQCSTDFNGSVDLGVAANHWHNVVHCDNSVEVVGCQGDATYTATVSIDGPGPNDFSDTVTGTIAAVQDPDVVEVCDACPIGACVSACQADCPQGDTECGQCCECWCKDEGLKAGNAACQPQNLCYTGSPGHAVCLSEQPLPELIP